MEQHAARTAPLTHAVLEPLTAQLEDITVRNFDTFGHTYLVFSTIARDGDVTPMRYSGSSLRTRPFKQAGFDEVVRRVVEMALSARLKRLWSHTPRCDLLQPA